MQRRIATLALFLAATLLAVEVPRPAPDFAVLLPEGGQLTLSQYRGKVVVIEFLLTTCPHCQHAAQVLTKMQQEFGPKGFQAIGCSFDPMPRLVVPDFIRDMALKHPVGFSDTPQVYEFLQAEPNYAVHVPQLVFIDRKGVIRSQSQPRADGDTAKEENVRSWIEKLLAEPVDKAPAPKPKS